MYHAAKTVHAVLLSQELNMPWPPRSTKINNNNIRVPTIVYNLFAWNLCEDGKGEEENVNAGQRKLPASRSVPCPRPLIQRLKGEDENALTHCLTYGSKKSHWFKRSHHFVE